MGAPLDHYRPRIRVRPDQKRAAIKKLIERQTQLKTQSKEAAREFLVRSGVYTKDVNLKGRTMSWKIKDNTENGRGYLRLVDQDGLTVCDIFPFAGVGGAGLDKARENARKMIHADQLWDALQGLKDWCEEGCPEGGRHALVEAEAALKAIRVEPA
jgi:hypothetical protein